MSSEVRHWTPTTGPICAKGHSLSDPASFKRNSRNIRVCARCLVARGIDPHTYGTGAASERQYRRTAQALAVRANVAATHAA